MPELNTRRDPRPEEWRAAEKTPLPANLDEFLRKSVARFSSDTLLDYFEIDHRVTYGEFGRLVDQLADVLRRLGVRRGSRVGVMLPSSPEFRALTFALARLRGICVPINTRYTASELDYVAADADISLLLIDAAYVAAMSSSDVLERLGSSRVITLGEGESSRRALSLASIAQDPADFESFESDAELDDVTHIQYTSGTTGFPKGCLLTQRYWLTAAVAYEAVGHVGKRLLDDMPYFYMAGPLWLFRAMSTGGALVIPRRASLRRFLSWLHEQRIDFCWFPGQLLSFPPGARDRGHSLRRALIYNVVPEKIAKIEERFGIMARDFWSMTETGIGTFVPWDAPEVQMAGSVGVPMPFREFKIIDDDLEEVPDGETGELCVRGPGMFVGYHERPKVNDELLLGDGWFRTGDRARRDGSGWIYFLGRTKDMVRRSGENIASAEVEHALQEMPAILLAAVVAVPDEWRDEEVKAYVVLAPPENRESVPPEVVYSWCAKRLASFKIPRYLEYRDDLPLTPSDKVAKQVLLAEKPDLRVGCYDRIDGIWR